MRECKISNLLGQLHADELNELDRQVAEVVRAVETTGTKGEITLKISLKKNGSNSTLVSQKTTTKVPRPAPSDRVLFFAYDDMGQPTGDLSENPPRQEPLPLERPRVMQGGKGQN